MLQMLLIDIAAFVYVFFCVAESCKDANPCFFNIYISVWSTHRKVIFEKQWFYLDNAVGHLYSTTFEIVSGGILQLQKLKDTESSAGVYAAV